MPTLTIDGRRVTVPEGQTILDAARSIGIDIPTLCWYPKLSIAGNCRICLVSVEGNPKLAPACAIHAADGMQVTTESAAAVKNRRAVLGMLLERYPAHEIPVGGARNEFEQIVRRYEVPTANVASLPLREGARQPHPEDPEEELHYLRYWTLAPHARAAELGVDV